jgi:hypothetical protein
MITINFLLRFVCLGEVYESTDIQQMCQIWLQCFLSEEYKPYLQDRSWSLYVIPASLFQFRE